MKQEEREEAIVGIDRRHGSGKHASEERRQQSHPEQQEDEQEQQPGQRIAPASHHATRSLSPMEPTRLPAASRTASRSVRCNTIRDSASARLVSAAIGSPDAGSALTRSPT